MQEFQRLADQVVKQGSLEEGSANISDTLLVKINETAVLFFDELQRPLLSNSDAGWPKLQQGALILANEL